jgi:hypothetical protein
VQGAAGAAFEPFYSYPDESAAQPIRPAPRVRLASTSSRCFPLLMLPVLGAFLLVNLLGLVFLAARGALRWVRAGYR